MSCQNHELSLSALIDGELETAELAPTLDHMVDCESCRTFYRRARVLDRNVREAVSDELWERISAEAQVAPAQPPRQRRSVAMATIAASLLLGSALLWVSFHSDPGSPQLQQGAPDPSYVEVLLESRPMSEGRFIELTQELLQADRRYHHEMLDVMNAVTRPEFGGEGDLERDHFETDEAVIGLESIDATSDSTRL